MRILLVLLMDKDARPTPDDMKLWVRVISFVKRGARGGAFGFFTYMELSTFFSSARMPGTDVMSPNSNLALVIPCFEAG